MSVLGLSFEIDSEYAVGEEISMTIFFRGAAGSPLIAHCSGKVMRADRLESRWRVEATIEQFTF